MRTGLLLVLLLPSIGRAEGFKFRVPPGWVDLSPDAPAANLARIPPEMLKEVRAGGFPYFAADIDHADDGFAENVNASFDHGREDIDQALVDEIAAGIGEEILRKVPGSTVKVIDKRLVHFGAAPVARIVIEQSQGALRMRQVLFHLPGVDAHANLTFSSTPEAFAQYEATFDTAAAATEGVVVPPSGWQRIGRSAGRGAIVGGLAGGLAVLLFGFLAKRRKTS